MEQPFYNHETIDTAWTIITKYVTPMLASAGVANASGVARTMTPIQGNCMAVGAVETAIWDLEAKLLKKPLWQHLGGTKNVISCGVSIGLQKSPEILLEKVAHEVASGYQRIKIKIKPGQDIELVKAVRKKFPDITLSVDANSAYSLERDVELLHELDDYNSADDRAAAFSRRSTRSRETPAAAGNSYLS
jgi:O-succinylbenzoate synthase